MTALTDAATGSMPEPSAATGAPHSEAAPESTQEPAVDTLCVGTVKGPGETPHEYTFIAPDPERIVKHGEFVYYHADVDGAPRRILGRVTARAAVKLFPDSFMADPSVPPGEVAALLGYDSSECELFEITVTVLGYHDPQIKDFINPRVPPAGGSPVFLAEDALLADVLSRKAVGARGSAYLGDLLSRSPGRVRVAVDVTGFTSTHLAIIASTGSGKSYLAGVLLEEMMMPHNRAAVLIVDPHGEYHTLQEMANFPEFRSASYKPTVRIFHPDQVHVRFDTLELGDIAYLMPGLSEKMYHELRTAFNRARKAWRDGYSIAQFEMAIGQADEGDGDQENPTTGALLWRLGRIKHSKIFSDVENLDLRELYKPGQCTVLQLNEVDAREQQVIVATLLRRMYQARVDTMKQKATRGEPNYLPFPVFCLIEEAHNFAPANVDNSVSTEQLKTILSEGRKFGVSVGLISQRPGKIDSDVLSQCMTQCIMRITNPIDQDKIASSVESVGRDLIRELPSLSRGQVIVSGASVNTPVLLRVRRRITKHGGQSVDAPDEWGKWFDEGREQAAARDKALIADPVFNYEDDGDILYGAPR